ncbi:exodeoxyribonuclease VII large subunit [Modestobacter sp. I12A-02628]|uniref:Exodeoxyribonuclease 7 large subunit n=1 Tax=Goekera deserti TaxID=2497753 RepID=A0A7K3WCJ1_9ACTN|nr:exodeoxyribonuclease VII large subunit [Goekera deserti]MPQ98603.1 exodeoxyribonuclease VII large subunit [Goekera deserti]NDI49027.1 exodeoxyribonuclease VII large subunit [Goekera deserti]NEL54182.1 exodeoxyribonuclease VII large subunit [Goekera deserti]
MTSPSSPESPWPVRTVARKVAEWIGRLGEVWVEGQVAQLSRRGAAATVFLTLRDPAADLSVPVTCHRDVADRPGLELTEGARVIVRARPDYYVARGSFSLRATEIRAVGLGELLARIERIRQLLAAEGLFDAVRKRPLPFAPAVLGVITGRESAAERDVLVTARRRWPAIRFAVHHCAVQGPTAAASVMEGLRRLDADPKVAVIVIARGGGSVEDLLPFSDEGLVRAIAACRTPVVTAVGHETDTTLVDHVADVRAATPTDAAHRVVPEIGEQRRLVDGLRARARALLSARLDQQERWLESTRSRPVLAEPQRLLGSRADEVVALRARAVRTLTHRVEGAERDLEHARARVAALSPAATLERGYAVVQRADGALVRDPAEVSAGELLAVRVAGGRLPVRVQPAGAGEDATP